MKEGCVAAAVSAIVVAAALHCILLVHQPHLASAAVVVAAIVVASSVPVLCVASEVKTKPVRKWYNGQKHHGKQHFCDAFSRLLGCCDQEEAS
jgi:hypothetical protein